MEDRKFLTKKRVIIWLFLITFLPTALMGVLLLGEGKQWLYFHGEGLNGRVVEADTNVPVEGAVVIADWSTWPIGRGEGSPIVLIFWLSPLTYIEDFLVKHYGSGKTIVTATDKDGKFDIPAWSSFQPWTYDEAGPAEPRMCIYKPGYKTLYTDMGRLTMNGESTSNYMNNLIFKKSLTAKELEEDYTHYNDHGAFTITNTQDWLKTADLIEKALVKVPLEVRKKIEKDIDYDKKRIQGANR